MRHKRTTALTAAVVLMGLGAEASAQDYQSYSCLQLWKARNSIYKAAGYCFSTERARRYFGNQGCSSHDANDLPLSGADRAAVAGIVRRERDLGCGF